MAKTEDVLFEHELKDRLNAELDSAEIFVSEDLIARTRKAVQDARETASLQSETGSVVKPEQGDFAALRGRKAWNSSHLIARIGTVAAAGIILVVGLYAFRMTAMKSKEGQNDTSMAPRAMLDAKQETGTQENDLIEEKSSVSFGFVGTGKNSVKPSEATDAVTADAVDEEVVEQSEPAETPRFADADGLPGNALSDDTGLRAETAAESNEENEAALQEETSLTDLKQSEVEIEYANQETDPLTTANDGLSALFAQLSAADRVTIESSGETTVYLFWLTDADGAAACYRVTPEGEVSKAKILPDGSQGEFRDDDVIITENDREAVKRWLENQKFSS